MFNMDIGTAQYGRFHIVNLIKPIPENVTNIYSIFEGCSELKTTIILKTNSAEYAGAFKSVNSESRINWMAPCTEEFVDAVLTESENIAIKGIEVTE